MYDSSSKNSFRSAYRQNEAEMDVVLATSLSSDYKTAEPFLSQEPENEGLSNSRAGEYGLNIDIKVFDLDEANQYKYI